MTTLWRMMVRAAPTCTLWVYDPHARVFRFRFKRDWVITDIEYFLVELGML